MVKYLLFCTGTATGLMEFLRSWGSLVQSLLCTGAQLAGTTKYVNYYKSYFCHVHLKMHITRWYLLLLLYGYLLCMSSGGLCWLWWIPTCWKWSWWKNVSPTSPTGGWELTRLNTKMGQNTKTYSSKDHTVKWYCMLCSLIQHKSQYCCLQMNMWECVQYMEGHQQVIGFKMWINKCHKFSFSKLLY